MDKYRFYEPINALCTEYSTMCRAHRQPDPMPTYAWAGVRLYFAALETA